MNPDRTTGFVSPAPFSGPERSAIARAHRHRCGGSSCVRITRAPRNSTVPAMSDSANSRCFTDIGGARWLPPPASRCEDVRYSPPSCAQARVQALSACPRSTVAPSTEVSHSRPRSMSLSIRDRRCHSGRGISPVHQHFSFALPRVATRGEASGLRALDAGDRRRLPLREAPLEPKFEKCWSARGRG